MAKEQEEVSRWQSRIQSAKKGRDRERDTQEWQRFLAQYKGTYDVGALSTQMAVVPINLVFAYVQTEIPKLYFRDPYFAVNAKGTQYIQRAKVLEVALNYLVQELNMKYEIYKTLLDTILIGHGWLKFGYTGTFGKTVTAEDVKGKGKNKKPLDEVNEFVKSESLFSSHVSWEDIVFDDCAKDPPYDCHWIAHRIIKPLKSVKNSETYKNTEKLTANYKPDDKEFSGQKDIELVELWEIWDKDTNSIYVITDGVENFLRNQSNPYEMEGLPFCMLKFNHVPGKPYPLSDIALIEPQIMEKIKLRSMQLNHLKRWNRQAFYAKGTLTEEEMGKYKTGTDGGLIGVDVGDKSIQDVLHVPQYPTLQAEIFQIENLIQLDIDTIGGQTQTDRGAPAATRTRTLGEVELLQNSSLTRSSKKQDSLEDFMEEVARKLIQLMKQFQLTPKYARALGEDTATLAQQLKGSGFDGQGLTFTKDDIQGDFDVEAKAGSTIPLSKENRLKVLTQILALGPAMGILPGGKVARAVGKEILRDLGIPDAEKAWTEEEQQLNASGVMGQALGAMGGQQNALSNVQPTQPSPPMA